MMLSVSRHFINVMTDELESILKEVVLAYLRIYLSIYQEGMRKAMKNVREDSLCSGQDSNQAPIEYKSRLLPLNQSVYSKQERSIRLHIQVAKWQPTLERVDKTLSRPIGTVNRKYKENGSSQNHYRRDMFL